MKHLKHYVWLAVTCCSLAFALTACGRTGTGTTTNKNTSNGTAGNAVSDVTKGAGNAVSDAANGVGDAAKNVAEGAGNAVKDAANGIGDATDDLVGSNGFNSYNEAHDYFLDTMGAYHSDAKFELRDEDKNLNDYQEGSKGYHFTLYDTSKNAAGEKFGEFYVDSTSGKIYKKGTNNKVEEYPASSTVSSNRK